MPQNQTCIRCGSILPGSTVPCGVEPPRAGKIEKTLRLASVIRIMNRFTGVAANCLDWIWQKTVSNLQFQIRSPDLTILGMFWKGILPGLAQWYIGRKPHDKIYFFGWLILVCLTLLTFGLPIFGVLIGLMFAWHLASIYDIALITCKIHSDRFFLFCLMVIGALLLFYAPTVSLGRSTIGRHLGVQVVAVDAGPLRNGDALFYTWSVEPITPQVGDVVLYQAPSVQYQGRGQAPGQGEPVQYLLAGHMFDRVLALEGQMVSWKDGALTVDGEPSPYQPLVLIQEPPDAAFVVPAGQCYIVPSVALQHLQVPREARHWEAMGLVHNGNVDGVVWGARRSLFHFVDLHFAHPHGEAQAVPPHH